MLSELEKRYKKLLKQEEDLMKKNENIIQYVFKKQLREYYYEKDEKKYVIRIIFDLEKWEIKYSIIGKEMEMEMSSHELIFDKYPDKILIIVKILVILKEINNKINNKISELKEYKKEDQRKIEIEGREFAKTIRKIEIEGREFANAIHNLEIEERKFLKNITSSKLMLLVNKRVLNIRIIDSKNSYYYEKEVGNSEFRIMYDDDDDGAILYSLISYDYPTKPVEYHQSIDLHKYSKYSINTIDKLIEVFRELNYNLDNVETSESISHTKGTHGGRKAPIVKKEINGRLRCIYKIAGSRKEHLKYKGQLITVADYKKLIKKV
jgi:hypothetical protein